MKILFLLICHRMLRAEEELRCSGYDSKGKCTFCCYSYIDAAGRCQAPEKTIDGCYSYESEGKCLECFFGYLKKRDKTCEILAAKNMETCFISYISTTLCTHCRNQTLTLNGKCNTSKKCSDINCRVCYMWGSVETCYWCKEGFMMMASIRDGAQCVPQTPERSGCYWTDRYDDCIWCDYGYYYHSNKTCLPTEITEMYRKHTPSLTTLGIILFTIIQ